MYLLSGYTRIIPPEHRNPQKAGSTLSSHQTVDTPTDFVISSLLLITSPC